jgi:hypothetical protein
MRFRGGANVVRGVVVASRPVSAALGRTKAPKSLGTAMAKPDARSEDRDFIGYRQEEMRRRLAVYSTT